MMVPIVKALKAGITVVNFDVSLDPAAMKKAGLDLAFVGPDNRGGAKLAGDELARALGPGAKMIEAMDLDDEQGFGAACGGSSIR